MKLELFGYTIIIEKKALEDTELPTDLQEAFKVLQKYGYRPNVSPKKTDAARRATEIRKKRTQEKIQNAINLLKMEGKEITPYAVAKVAGVSYNTAKKYLK
jgi:hypothetical protein